MAKRLVAEELVFQLAECGVKQIFGITGDALNAFTNAIRMDKRIEWFTVRHEETAAFAAAAQAEISGKLAVCAGTVGPGALHLVNGLYNAKRDGSPVLAITGQVPRAEAEGLYFQEVDQAKAFDDICEFNTTLQSPEQLPRVLQQAIESALTTNSVSHIAVPTDIAVESMVKTTQPIKLFLPQSVVTPTEEELQQVAKILNQAQRVSLLIGCGCCGYGNLVSEFAHKLQAPICHSLKGTEVLPFDHPLSIGGIGHVGTPHGLQVMDNCDVLMMLGTDFPYTEFLPQHGRIIQLDINPANVGKRIPVSQGLIGDVGATLEKLIPLIKTKELNPALSKLQKKRDKWTVSVNEKFALAKTKGLIHPQSVVLKVSELADDDAIFCGEVGEVTVWAARHLRMRGKQRLIGSFNHGSLGVGLPAAIGAQALDKHRQVIALSGDGGFAMLLADLVTAARYDLPLTVIVFNNSKFGFVELEMEASGMPRFATDLVNPDFAKVAQACGCEGIQVKDPQKLESALKQALRSKKPTVVEVFVNPSELIIPPSIDVKTAYKFTQGKIREMFIEQDIKVLFER